ncbi:proton-coupled amino acid transporter-like protein CG1139 isoform X2 [Plutella xylostella]|uniref:proton-coupled amino acid transporter-like protein CG1139 isoform X2 n=1 Tax=Plutella xylostella TaxID=51655 RepID=UPI002032E4B4|nr:proton-coupled amino acid transporter-like protein CG1139 isoform X2 [Plutella xylostella]
MYELDHKKEACDSINDDVTPSQTQSTITLHRDGKYEDTLKYDPFQHRNVAHPTSTLGSFCHLLKSSLGSGLFAMPAAFKHAGLIPGCLGSFLVGFIATHCVHILVRTSRELCEEFRVPSLSYTDTCETAFSHGPKRVRQYSRHVRYFADFAMAGVCIGGTSVYVSFVSSSLKDIFDSFFPDYKLGYTAYCALILLPLILITQFRYLKFLVPFSIAANMCLVVTFLITFYYIFTHIPAKFESSLSVSAQEWPLFVSTVLFAMEGINVVMPVENEMAKPQHFLGCPGVLNATMILVTLLYTAIGATGYLAYGDQVLGSVTLNLPQHEIFALIAKCLVAVAVFFTYCLQMYAPMDIIWTRMRSRVEEKYHNVAQIVLRTGIVVVTVILAIAVPDLELLIGVVGAIFFSTLGLLIPIVVETVHKWDRGLGPFKYVLWKNVLLLLFYIVVLCSGCYASISAIVAKYSTHL